MRRWILGLVLTSMLGIAACSDDAEEEASRNFVAACQDYCIGVANADCENQPITEAQCVAACPVYEEQLPLCKNETAAVFACAAASGFECVDGNAFPKAACIAELTAQAKCMEGAACQQFCNAASGTSCGGTDDSACIATCSAELMAMEDVSCDWEYEDLLTCWGEGVECNGSKPAAGNCGAEVLDVGDCLSYDGLCDGYCFAAELLGCGDGCDAECDSKTQGQCSSEYRQLRECQLRSNDATCSGGALTTSDCDYDQQQYDDCVAGT